MTFDLFGVRRLPRDEAGQAGLIVLLLTVVILTIGISVASRSTSDLSLSRQEEESNKAFNAAEAGVEEALTQNLNFSGSTLGPVDVPIDSEVNVDYTIDKVNVLETRLFEGVSGQVDVAGVANGQGIQIRWAKETNCSQTPASILVTVFASVSGTARARNFTYRPCATPSDGSTSVSTDPSGEYFRQVTLNLQSGDQFVRIKPLYKDTNIRVQGSGWGLPTQYYQVRSVAESNFGDEVRAVQVNRTKPVAPATFDFLLYSGTAISK